VIVVFQTDGEENASRDHSLDELWNLIERRRAEGWQFVFLGADMDAYSTATVGVARWILFSTTARDTKIFIDRFASMQLSTDSPQNSWRSLG
jgi:hypothetical protein